MSKIAVLLIFSGLFCVTAIVRAEESKAQAPTAQVRAFDDYKTDLVQQLEAIWQRYDYLLELPIVSKNALIVKMSEASTQLAKDGKKVSPEEIRRLKDFLLDMNIWVTVATNEWNLRIEYQYWAKSSEILAKHSDAFKDVTEAALKRMLTSAIFKEFPPEALKKKVGELELAHYETTTFWSDGQQVSSDDESILTKYIDYLKGSVALSGEGKKLIIAEVQGFIAKVKAAKNIDELEDATNNYSPDLKQALREAKAPKK